MVKSALRNHSALCAGSDSKWAREPARFDKTVEFGYNGFGCAEVAQLVEHLTENQGVPSSSLGLGTSSGSGSVVEHLLAKERVASSNLVFRS
jgi:hypothetical protein